jgi:hypothetical protein
MKNHTIAQAKKLIEQIIMKRNKGTITPAQKNAINALGANWSPLPDPPPIGAQACQYIVDNQTVCTPGVTADECINVLGGTPLAACPPPAKA